jgi:hypothetical protein
MCVTATFLMKYMLKRVLEKKEMLNTYIHIVIKTRVAKFTFEGLVTEALPNGINK